MTKYLFLFGLALLTTSVTLAADEPKKTPPTSFRDVMHDFGDELLKLKVFSTLPSDSLAPEQVSKVRTELGQFKNKIRALDQSNLPSTKTYTISLKALQKHIEDTDSMFEFGNSSYARWMLNATTTICISCHTQMPTQTSRPFALGPYPKAVTAQEKFYQAEYLFVTRQFDNANMLYDHLIRHYPQNKLDTVLLDRALRRKLSYFARIKRDPEAGMKSLSIDRENQKLPTAIAQNVLAWEALFRQWSKEQRFDFSGANAQSLLKYVNKKLERTLWDRMIEANDPRVVTYLQVSGLLYEFLYTHPRTSETPEILLLLGRCENALNDYFLYSLGDLYLRDCIENYSQNPTAKLCYAELEKSLEKAYQTTTGLQMPSDLIRELKGYRTQLKINESP